jgi:hypothetical protein
MTSTSHITDALNNACSNTAKPMSKASLQQFVDLGLDDFEIARYYEVKTVNVTRLRNYWAIEVDPQIATPNRPGPSAISC